MKKKKNEEKRITGKLVWLPNVFLLMGMLFALLLFVKPDAVQAATVKYATYNSGVYKVGNHTYKTVVRNSDGTDPTVTFVYKDTKATLYEIKNGKSVKLKTYKPGDSIIVKAEYGNWLYYTVSRYGSDSDLYRYNRSTKKSALVRSDVNSVVIYKNKLYTVGHATDISNVPIYVCDPDGKNAKCITKNGSMMKVKIYNNRLYYVEKTFNSNYSKISNRLMSCNLSGGNKKALTSKLWTPKLILYYTNKKLIFYTYTKSGSDYVQKYYQMNLSTGSAKQIFPTQATLNKWYDSWD
jgi:predicted transcriptional regulator